MQPTVHGIAAETLKKEGHSVAEAHIVMLALGFQSSRAPRNVSLQGPNGTWASQ